MDPQGRPPGLSGARRVYARLLGLYPESFRERYGSDALDLFQDRYVEACQKRGWWGVTMFWVRTISNVIWNGALERISAARGPGSLSAPRAGSSAFRAVRRSPALSAVIVLTLGAGIGSTVALFSVVSGVLLHPLPFPQPERLVQIWETNPSLGGDQRNVSPWDFADWDEVVPGFESMTSWYQTSGTLRTEASVEEVQAAHVTADFFRVLGVNAALGRTFRREEVVRYGPVVLSHGLWERMFGGDPDIIGKPVSLSGASYEVIGVMPDAFSFPDDGVEAWLAWDMATVYETRPEARTWRFLSAIGRLSDGISVRQAEGYLQARMAALAEIHPAADRGWTAQLGSLHEAVIGDVRATLWIAFGAVLSLLLIACANVANLLLARVPARSREFAIRASLGASRPQMLLELAAESLTLALLAGVFGLGLGALLLDLFVALDAGRIPRLAEVQLDGPVLGFTLALTLGTSVLFGLIPAFTALRGSAVASLRDGNRTSGTAAQHRVREVFVSAQVAVALVLITGAVLFRASFQRVNGLDPGFVSEGVATFRVSMDREGGGGETTVRYYRSLIQDLGAIPGVLAVGAAQTLPMDPVAGDFTRPYRVAGGTTESADAPTTGIRVATPGYVSVMGMRLLEGGDFSGGESMNDARVAIVNRTLARRLWPAGPAVGDRFEMDWLEGWSPYTVVGVVDDLRHDGPRKPTREEVYVSHRQVPYLAMSVAVRTTGDPESLTPALRAVVQAQERAQPAYNFVTLPQLRRRAVAEERFLAALLGVFSGIALFLASAGVYGVIAYSVSHRRREIGVRMALGARQTAVVGQVLRRAAVMTGSGAIAGLVIVRLVGGLVEGALFGVTAWDWGSITSAAAAVLIVALVAAYVPARRAAEVPPGVALSSD